MRDLEERHGFELDGCIAEHIGEGTVDFHDAPVERDDGHADRRILHGAPEALLAFGDAAAVDQDLPDEEAAAEMSRKDDREEQGESHGNAQAAAV